MSDVFFIKGPNFKVESLSENVVQIKERSAVTKKDILLKQIMYLYWRMPGKRLMI